jgi:hypothetical protein
MTMNRRFPHPALRATFSRWEKEKHSTAVIAGARSFPSPGGKRKAFDAIHRWRKFFSFSLREKVPKADEGKVRNDAMTMNRVLASLIRRCAPSSGETRKG